MSNIQSKLACTRCPRLKSHKMAMHPAHERKAPYLCDKCGKEYLRKKNLGVCVYACKAIISTLEEETDSVIPMNVSTNEIMICPVDVDVEYSLFHPIPCGTKESKFVDASTPAYDSI